MNPRIKLAAMTALILMAHHANAGEVTNLTTFTAGTPAKAQGCRGQRQFQRGENGGG